MALATAPTPSILTDGDLVAGFIEAHCRITKGPRRGQLVVLLPWELELLDALFEIDPATMRRRYRRALLGMPRKNGKSLLDAGFALYMLTSDGENGAEVYCLAPKTRVLCADLVWRAVGDVKQGDSLVAFDEECGPTHYRKLRMATVTESERITQPCYRVVLSDGREIIASSRHRWLARNYKTSLLMRWTETAALRAGARIRDLGQPWETDNSRDGGYLAGIFDGEGCIVGGQGGNYRRGSVVSFAQNPGIVLDKATRLLSDRRVPFVVRKQSGLKEVAEAKVTGLYNCLRLLGSIQAHRLIAKVPRWLDGQTPNRVSEATVVSVEYVGERNVVAIGTSTRTLFAEGLFSHNSCAGDKDQAKIVFGEAKQHVELDPELSQRLKLYKDVIFDPVTESIYKALSAEAYTKEGLNPSAVAFDELHVQPNRELWDVMTQGSGTRDQPLVLATTTAGFDKDSLCYEMYTHGKAVDEGRAVDPAFFFRWWEPSNPKCDHRDRAVWYEVNPSLGEHLRESDMEDALQAPENVFRRYRLNQWTDANTSWLPPDAWDSCIYDIDLDQGLPVRVAIDLSQYHDAAAVAIAQHQPTVDRIVVRSRIWENPFEVGTDAFLAYQVPVADLRNYLREIATTYPAAAAIDEHGRGIPGPEFAFDPWGMAESADILEQEKLNMLKFPQNESRMVPASSDFYRAIGERRVAHNGDPILARHINAAVAKPTDRGWRLARPKGKRVAMDGAIAAGIAVHRALQPSPKPKRSAYEDRGLTSA